MMIFLLQLHHWKTKIRLLALVKSFRNKRKPWKKRVYSTFVLMTLPSSNCNFVKFKEVFLDAGSLFMETSLEVNLTLSCGSSSARACSSTFLWTVLTPIPGLQIRKESQNEHDQFPFSNPRLYYWRQNFYFHYTFNYNRIGPTETNL